MMKGDLFSRSLSLLHTQLQQAFCFCNILPSRLLLLLLHSLTTLNFLYTNHFHPLRPPWPALLLTHSLLEIFYTSIFFIFVLFLHLPLLEITHTPTLTRTRPSTNSISPHAQDLTASCFHRIPARLLIPSTSLGAISQAITLRLYAGISYRTSSGAATESARV